MTKQELNDTFKFGRLDENKRDLVKELFNQAHQFAEFINNNCCESREKALAITAIQQAMLWADAAIGRHGVITSEE